MKTKFIYFMLMALLFSACSQEEINNVETSKEPTKDSGYRFYGVKQVDKGNTKGTAVLNKLWHTGTPISIKFLDGTAAMQDQVKQYAAEWLNYAGLTFNYVGAADKADVRISFGMNDTRYVTWSYTGTDCKTVTDQTKATMNFAFWNESTAQEQKGDVLRAFGQMMGLEFEHRHLALNPTWGSNIQNYWTQDISDIPWETLKEYVMTPLSSANTVTTKEYDPSSIMIWPFVGRGLVTYSTGYTVPSSYNSELSALDKEFIAQLYPKAQEQPIITIDLAWFDAAGVDRNQANFMLAGTKPIRVDWGDGTTQNIELAIPEYPGTSVNGFHTYSEAKPYVVKIYGDASDITLLHIYYCNPTSLDLTKLSQLKELMLIGTKSLTSIDLSKNLNLEILNIYDLNLSSLNVANNLKLKDLSVGRNQLTTLDVSNNTELVSLDCSENKIASLNVSKNTKLETISLVPNPIVNSQTAMINFGNTLPSRVGLSTGNISLSGNYTAVLWIKNNATAKNWKLYY